MITCICDICKRTTDLEELRPGGKPRSIHGQDLFDSCHLCWRDYQEALSGFFDRQHKQTDLLAKAFIHEWIAERTKA